MLVTSLLERHNNQQQTKSLGRSNSTLNRLKSFSFRQRRSSKVSNTFPSNGVNDDTSGDDVSGGAGIGNSSGPSSFIQAMPTIMESNTNGTLATGISTADTPAAAVSSTIPVITDRPGNASTGVRHMISTIANAPHRFSHSGTTKDEENTNLTENLLD